MQVIASALWGFGHGQGARQFAELGLSLLLSSLIGLERAARQKSGGLRTHTLVGVGSTLFMEVSQHGFMPVLGHNVALDPSRVAAQIVSGIGFIGGGLIFVRRDVVKGLTTAATVWLTCAIGMACGGGLALLATAATGVHFLVVRGYPPLTRRLGPGLSAQQVELQLSYQVGRSLLPRILELCTGRGFSVLDTRIGRAPWEETETLQPPAEYEMPAPAVAQVLLRLEGRGEVHQLVGEIAELHGVLTAEIRHDVDAV
ncbi:MgtC/SapB family protein [Streptomyces shenzhenensis]|uniref:Magnesium transporter MgtC n=1 Tax=Streptomyces shenzhenensis TaxID=943815 RepID=A0A3M0HVA5_9ACTN|nr:MgtC/SapB family protein [Streptomyces shenzhenensis]RMB80494.1 magnesium transporter MgtC [Streptomyces shenzhenensis]